MVRGFVAAALALFAAVSSADAGLFSRNNGCGGCAAPVVVSSCGGCNSCCTTRKVKVRKVKHNHCCPTAPSCCAPAPAPTCCAPAPAPVCAAPAPSCCAPAPKCCAPAPKCCAPAPACHSCAPAACGSCAPAAAAPAAPAAAGLPEAGKPKEAKDAPPPPDAK